MHETPNSYLSACLAMVGIRAVVTHFWVPMKNNINSQKRLEKITGGRSAQKTVRKLVKEFKNTRIEFLTVYS